MNTAKLGEVLEDFLSLIYPKLCFNCKRALVYQEDVLCTHCRWTLPETDYHLDPANALYQKFAYESKVKFAASFLYFNRQGIARKLIHPLKYKNMPAVGEHLGRWYGQKLSNSNIQADLIIPVPLHKKRLAERGYNQSEKFANGLSEVLDIPVEDKWVIRRVPTNTQTKKKKVDRWLNVDNVFECKTSAGLFRKNVIIVDDVITTGATMGMMVDKLASAGVKSIGILAIASGQ